MKVLAQIDDRQVDTFRQNGAVIADLLYGLATLTQTLLDEIAKEQSNFREERTRPIPIGIATTATAATNRDSEYPSRHANELRSIQEKILAMADVIKLSAATRYQFPESSLAALCYRMETSRNTSSTATSAELKKNPEDQRDSYFLQC